jgi:hypothetical protein
MVASTFEGMFLSLWLCVIAGIVAGVAGLTLVKSQRKRLGLTVGLIGLLISFPFLLDAIRYSDQTGWLFSVASVIAFGLNLVSAVWHLFRNPKPRGPTSTLPSSSIDDDFQKKI